MSGPAPQPPPLPQDKGSSPGSAAPADARPHRPWPWWRMVLAYVLLSTLAVFSIWYIDRQAHRPASPQPPTRAAL